VAGVEAEFMCWFSAEDLGQQGCIAGCVIDSEEEFVSWLYAEKAADDSRAGDVMLWDCL
jgi:hypothetical protein